MLMNNNFKKIIWIHRFPKSKLNAGIFMFNIFNKLKIEYPDNFKLNSCNKINDFSALFIKSITGKSNIFHAQYGSFTGFLVLFLKGKKILTLRGSDLFVSKFGNLYDKIHSRFAVLLTYISLFGYSKIILMSHDMKKMIPRFFHKKIIILPDPIDYDKFYPQEEKKEIYRKKYFNMYDIDIKLILFVSIDLKNPIKRYNLAFNSVNLANIKTGYHKFQLVTATNIEHNYMNEVMNAVDICLLTSTHEGWPNCIKEAIATNTPFVATDVSDLRETILYKNCNCFVTNDNAEDIANSILNVKLNKSINLRMLLNDFSYSNYNKEILKIYNEISP